MVLFIHTERDKMVCNDMTLSSIINYFGNEEHNNIINLVVLRLDFPHVLPNQRVVPFNKDLYISIENHVNPDLYIIPEELIVTTSNQYILSEDSEKRLVTFSNQSHIEKNELLSKIISYGRWTNVCLDFSFLMKKLSLPSPLLTYDIKGDIADDNKSFFSNDEEIFI